MGEVALQCFFIHEQQQVAMMLSGPETETDHSPGTGVPIV